MSVRNFTTFYDFIEAPDNDGQPFHITPGDPGGATVYGWTYATWSHVAPYHGIEDISLEAFRAQTKVTLAPMTRAWFWNRLLADDMPAGFDLFWCDFQFGSGAATRVLQGCLGVTPDGVVGRMETLPALDRLTDPADRVRMLTRMYDDRVGYYDACGFRDRWPGLYRRAAACRDLALRLTVMELADRSAGA
ncbi:MAG TPA: glycosyl hydrolase 108 family protein [Gammaproteobacteria bacterium]|nr:glycosyl hydrolase 108 family protein [Gammaproteobacteria bacterium]